MFFLIMKREISLKGQPSMYSITQDVLIKFVHIYNGKADHHDKYGYLKSSVMESSSLNKVVKRKSIQKFLKHLKQVSETKDQTKRITTTTHVSPRSLLYSFLPNNDKSTFKPIRIMENRKATLVIIEGSITSLCAHDDISYHHTTLNGKVRRKKPFLLPFAKDALNGLNSKKFHQRFHLKKLADPFATEPNQNSEHVNAFDDSCKTDPDLNGPIATTCYDISKYKDGLIFAFRRNDELNESKVVHEVEVPKNMQPNEIYKAYGAIVLSEWFLNEQFYHVNNEAIQLVQKVHGESGFGNRSRASSAGTNVYHGERQSFATVGKPL